MIMSNTKNVLYLNEIGLRGVFRWGHDQLANIIVDLLPSFYSHHQINININNYQNLSLSKAARVLGRGLEMSLFDLDCQLEVKRYNLQMALLSYKLWG